MTGGELVAGAIVGKVVEGAGKAVGEKPGVERELLKAAQKTPEFERAALQYAKRIEVRQTILSRLYTPLARLAGLQRDYFKNEFPSEMAKKLADVAAEDLTAPAGSIAAPALQGLAYSLDEPQLKEMYLDLLASASNSRTARMAHPAYAEIIRQLQSEEAEGLRRVLASEDHVVCLMQPLRSRPRNTRGYLDAEKAFGPVFVEAPRLVEARRHLVPVSLFGPPAVEHQSWIENWFRLGLIDVAYKTLSEEAEAYGWVRSHSIKLVPEEHSFNLEMTLIIRTTFGTRFARAVGILPQPPEEEDNGQSDENR